MVVRSHLTIISENKIKSKNLEQLGAEVYIVKGMKKGAFLICHFLKSGLSLFSVSYLN
jgi:hypothetical protein